VKFVTNGGMDSANGVREGHKVYFSLWTLQNGGTIAITIA